MKTYSPLFSVVKLVAGLLCWMLSLSPAWAAGPSVEFKTNYGVVVLELFPEKAPQTVDNFIQYVNSGFYDGVIFHRVIPGFMIQGGGFDANMKEKSHRPPIANEAKNGLKNQLGTIAMARTSNPHSAAAQFFINVADNPSLDYPSFDGWGYAVFGKVVQGLEVVQAIAKTQTATMGYMRDVPVKPVMIESARILSQSGR